MRNEQLGMRNKRVKKTVITLTLLMGIALSVFAQQQYDDESDFRVELINEGKAIRITAYKRGGREVRIPPKIQNLPVTEIGTEAFSKKFITSVIIPNSVTDIGIDAFSYNHLTEVIIPNSVTNIGKDAFKYCTSLTSFTIPKSVTIPNYYTGFNIFYGCIKLTEINVEANNSTFTSENGVLYNKNKTILFAYPAGKTETSFNIPNSVKLIGDFAFAGSRLTNITIPNSVTAIRISAFYRCRLTSVTIPDSVIGIYNNAFANNELTSVTIPNSITMIDGGAFINNKLTNITIPNRVTHIGGSAFENNLLTSVTIPNYVRFIYTNAFANNQITEIIMPPNTYSISEGSFDYNFKDFYEKQGRKAGTYTYKNNSWSVK